MTVYFSGTGNTGTVMRRDAQVGYRTSTEMGRSGTDQRSSHTGGATTSNTPTSINDARRAHRVRGPEDIQSGTGTLDASILDDALGVIESLRSARPDMVLMHLNSLSGLLCELWQSAAKSSTYHRQILSAADSAVLSATVAETVNDRQLSAIRGALTDLGQRTLTQANVDSIASSLIDEQFSPLAILGDMPDTSPEDYDE
jgi:hypothetical protein